jgi:hypothetical protein
VHGPQLLVLPGQLVAAGEGQVDGRLRSLLERISRAVPEQREKARHWIPCPKCSGEGKRLNTKGQMAVCPTCHGMKGKYV